MPGPPQSPTTVRLASITHRSIFGPPSPSDWVDGGRAASFHPLKFKNGGEKCCLSISHQHSTGNSRTSRVRKNSNCSAFSRLRPRELVGAAAEAPTKLVSIDSQWYF